MAIYHNIDNIPSFENLVLTVGTFDGVHMGHRAILKEVVSHAKNVQGTSVLLTFEPHPRKLLFPDQPLGIITPLNEKLHLISDTGIQHIVVVPFTREFASLSAESYIRDFLVGIFQPHTIIIGYDHRFGNDRKGNIKLLETHSAEYHYELIEIPPQLIDEAAVSSTKIRHAISDGRVADAHQMLGRPFALKGHVIHGNKLGRTLGYPTANLDPLDKDQIVPAVGIYAVKAIHDDITYNGMLSIGYNPTVSDSMDLRIEVNLFDFDKTIYDETLELLFVVKLRDEKKFPSLDALKVQLHVDKLQAQQQLAS